jgi:membrane associated rhomboid family serine protease
VAPIVVAAAVLVALLPEATARSLALEPSAVASGQVWRLVTCHLAHYDHWHVVRDVSLLAIVALVAGRRRAPALGISILAGLFLVPAAVLLLEPVLTPYRGASGLGAAALAGVGLSLAADRLLDTSGRALGALAVGVLMVLILYEAWVGRTVSVAGPSTSAVAVAYSSHLGGVLAGVVGFSASRISVG